ncbi:MAG: hypothetical protein Q9182_004866 [Xanthomendoza sp. 2 TL-2023]
MSGTVADTPSPKDSETRRKSYHNCVKVFPILSHPYATEAAPPRGRYPISSRLYEAIRAYLDSDSEWGFVVCCVGDREATVIEKRIEQLEAYLDRFPQELDGSPGTDHDVDIDSEGQMHRDDGDAAAEKTVEVHSTESDFAFSSLEKVHGLAAVNEAERMKNSTSGKMPQTEGSVIAGDSLLAVDVEDDSDSVSAYETARESMSRDLRDRARALPQQETLGSRTSKLSPISEDSVLSSCEDSDSGTAIPREERTRAPSSRIQKQRLESSRRQSQNTQFGNQPRDRERSFKNSPAYRWPTMMMSISPSSHIFRGMSSEKALKIVGDECRMNGLSPDVYTAFFAHFFTPSSMGSLVYTCQTYSMAKPWSRTVGQPATSNMIKPETSWAPLIIMNLLEAYTDAKSDETIRGPVISKALSFQKQAFFSQILDRVYSQLIDGSGEIWDFFIKALVTGPRLNRQSHMEQVNQFIIERAAGMTRDEMTLGIWTQARRQFTRIVILGRNMHKLSTLCTPAVFLVVAMMKGSKLHSSVRLQSYMQADALENFVTRLLEIFPEYRICLEKIETKVWIPVINKLKLPPSRLLRLNVSQSRVPTEIGKKSVLYWLGTDDEENDSLERPRAEDRDGNDVDISMEA